MIKAAVKRWMRGVIKNCANNPAVDTVWILLETRGNMVSDEFLPDPEGRYAVKVVDLKGELPKNPYELIAGYKGYNIAQQDVLKAGFARIVEE